jgi:hypothetical protein
MMPDREPPNERPLRPPGFFALRTPLLAFEEFEDRALLGALTLAAAAQRERCLADT